MKGMYRGAVVSIHGIMTTGKWQKCMVPILQDAAIRYEVVDYGWLWAFRIIRPFSGRCARKAWPQIESAISKQAEITENVCVIAHSFGSYCIGTMMLAMPSIAISKLILCGAILSRRFDWEVLFRRRQLSGLLNEVCSKDFPVLLAPLFVSGAGCSGRRGFDVSSTAVTQNVHGYSGHSDLLSDTHYMSAWVPFIWGSAMEPD